MDNVKIGDKFIVEVTGIQGELYQLCGMSSFVVDAKGLEKLGKLSSIELLGIEEGAKKRLRRIQRALDKILEEEE